MWFRPWLALAGVWFGLAAGTKWSALYALAAFGVLVWLWNAGARRSLGVRWPVLKAAVLDGVPAFVHLVLVAFVVYVASWTGWLVHAHEYEQHLSSTQYTRFVSDSGCKGDETQVKLDDSKRWKTATEPDASGLGEVTQSLRSLFYYHQDVYTFHTHFLNCSSHIYASDPGGWLVLQRPVGVNVENDIAPGSQGCDAAAGSSCLREVVLLGTPALWWGGALALRLRGGGVGAAPGLALRVRAGRGAVDVAAVAAQRRPADLLVLRLGGPAVHDHRADPDARRDPRPREGTRHPAAPSAPSSPAPTSSW